MALPGRLSGVRRETWLRWGIVVVGFVLVWVAYDVVGPGQGDVTERLEEQYDVGHVEWDRGSKTRPERLVVDGRDISKACTVSGSWGSWDDLEIVCVEEVGVGRVE